MHQFWDTQPVPREGVAPGEIEGGRECKSEPPTLPDGFMWSQSTLDEAHLFLSNYYVSNDTFRLTYTRDTLKWAIQDHVAIRKRDTSELVGYISSAPLDVRVEGETRKMVQINFLCIHPSLRSMRLAPILIGEIRRRANSLGIWQAMYTGVSRIPTPIAKANYWHRFLDVKKLIKLGFHKTNRPRENYYEVRGPSKYSWRKMTSRDVPRVTHILKEYTKDFKIAPVITKDYVKRWVLPTHAYVNDQSDTFISLYNIPYERNDGEGTVNQAYRFYLVGDVYNDAFLIAKNLGYDVLNSLDVGVGSKYLEDLKFMPGSGHVYYYLFNWNLSESIETESISLILP
jgi:glycylpeptide N-tetradecanoyltransferase